jgi:membrane protease YdiL (CAAX protease family)
VSNQQSQQDYTGIISVTLVFAAILAFLPIFFDFAVDLTRALVDIFGHNPALVTKLLALEWLADAIGYTVVYLLMLFYIKTTFEPLSSFGYKFSDHYLKWSVWIGIASGLIMFVIDWLSGYDTSALTPVTSNVVLGTLLTWVILPMLVEETLFRGVIQTFYQKKLTKTYTSHNIHIAVFIAVAAEVLFHLWTPMYYGIVENRVYEMFIESIPQLLYVAVFGFLSGVIYQRTGSLVGPFLIHGLGNLIEVLLIWAFL